MKLIVGLGNPGWVYRNTRHNIGSSVVKALAQSPRCAFKKEKSIPALIAKVDFDNQVVVLALPLTFMNLSGAAVGALLEKYSVRPEDLLVVCDDLELDFPRMKIRPSGASGGHRGLQSIINTIHSQGFARLRIGIGRPKPTVDVARYVLLPFHRAERKELKGLLMQACECCESWIKDGVQKSMNRFNRTKAIV